MSSQAVLKELDELRRMLDSPTSAETPVMANPTRAPDNELLKSYSSALNTADRNVDRLSRAIEMAEDEMESALKRTTDVHRSQAARRELEVQELRRVLAAKERSLDSLRDTHSQMKRTLESRIGEAEAALSDRDAQVARLNQELNSVRLERDALEQAKNHEIGVSARLNTEYSAKEEMLISDLRHKTEEHAKVLAALRYERKHKDDMIVAVKSEASLLKTKLARETELRRKFQRQLETVESMRAEREGELEAAAGAERARVTKAEERIKELKKALKSERHVRKASEGWIKAELKTRDEMESMFRALRDIAIGAPTNEVDQVKRLVEDLKDANPVDQLIEDVSVSKNDLEFDNRRLRSELRAARKLLKDRVAQRRVEL